MSNYSTKAHQLGIRILVHLWRGSLPHQPAVPSVYLFIIPLWHWSIISIKFIFRLHFFLTLFPQKNSIFIFIFIQFLYLEFGKNSQFSMISRGLNIICNEASHKSGTETIPKKMTFPLKYWVSYVISYLQAPLLYASKK